MEAPHLKLTVEKGPLEGKTVEKKPGVKIRIGRVLTGNNFVIKDDGISSKHLLIEFDSINWVVLDLDTSNGTFLNGVMLQPQTPFDLTDGDLIKIGELTSIKVSLITTQHEPKPKLTRGGSKKVEKHVEDAKEVVDLESEVGSKPPPKPTRGGSKRVEKPVEDAKEVVDLESEVGSKPPPKPTRGGSKRVEKPVEDAKEVVDLESEVGSKPPPKPTRGGSKRVEKPVEDAKEVDVLESEVGSKPPPKPTRGGSKRVEKPVEDAKEAVDLESEVGPPARRYPKRGAKKQPQPQQQEQQQIPESSLVSDDKKQKIRGKSKQENVATSVAENQGRRGRSRRGAAALRDEPVETLSDAVSERDIVGNNEAAEPSQSAAASVTDVPEVQKKSNSKKEACGESSNILERMKTMTLGEYLDYLEVYLVKKIYEETDEIIAGMREKAEKFKKFMLEQEQLKNKSPLF